MYLLNTFLGFVIAQLYDAMRGNRLANIEFWKKSAFKILASLVLSFSMALVLRFNWDNLIEMLGKELPLNDLVYLAIGAVPEWVLQLILRRYNVNKRTGVPKMKDKPKPPNK